MVARRLLVVLLVMLVASTVAALLAPTPRPPGPTSSTSTTTTDAGGAGGKRGGQERPRHEPSGRLVQARIAPSDPRPVTVRAEVGDQISVRVRSRRPDQVELRGFGLLADVSRFDPALFDVLAERPGRFDVRLLESRRTVGRIVVSRAARR